MINRFKIYYYMGRYAMIQSKIPAPPGTTIFVLLEDAMIPGTKGKKPTPMKDGEYLMCPKGSENIKERKDA